MNNQVIRLVFSLTAASLFALPLCAHKLTRQQKKDIDQAKTYIKSGKDYDKAEKLITPLFKDSANRSNLKLNALWFDAVRGQYDVANEKLYLKQKYDTAAFYQLTRHLQEVALTVDSLDALPDQKGRVRPSYRQENAELLHALRINIYYGGTWHVRKANYQTAFSFFDDYINAARQPLYEAYKYHQKDSLLPKAAYWATFCAFKMQDAERTLKHAQLAMDDKERCEFTLQYMCEAYQQLHNDSAYIATLEEGFRRYPDYPYFFPRLADYRTAQKRYDEVLQLAEQGLMVNEENPIFHIAKSVSLLNLERYNECIASSQQLIALNDSLPEPYFNIATCYLNNALTIEQEHEPRKNRQALQKLYQQARPYMEKYRKMAPSDQKRWAPALYRIYFNLNMGKEFEEIDRTMRNN
jgi:hypothetical protein